MHGLSYYLGWPAGRKLPDALLTAVGANTTFRIDQCADKSFQMTAGTYHVAEFEAHGL